MYTLADVPRPTVEQLRKLVAGAGGSKGGSMQAMPREVRFSTLFVQALLPG